MKYLRFSDQKSNAQKNNDKYGVLDGNTVREIKGEIFGDHSAQDITYKLDEVKILPPCLPTKIVGVGLNYREHAEEMGRDLPQVPRLFLKPHTSVIGNGDKIKYPDHMSERVDFEGELAVVISRKAAHVSEDDALNYVFGYTCMNDITARDLQAKDIQFTRAKGFDTFAPLGPVIETELNSGGLEISTYLNQERKQHSNTSNLLFGVPHLVSFVSSVMTLLPGDVISTGTPEGVAPMKIGDKVEVRIEGIGTLTNYVG